MAHRAKRAPGQERECRDDDQVGSSVGEIHRDKSPRFADVDDEPADDRADAEAQVEELEVAGEGQAADLVVVDHHSEKRVPRRPSSGLAQPEHEHGGQGAQGAVHGRDAGDTEPLHDHGDEHHCAGTDAVDEGTGHGADGQGEDCDAPDQKSRDPEGDVPNLVQVYDEKRKCQPAADRGSEARREQDAQGPWETTRGHRSILALSSRFLNRLCGGE